MDAFIGEVRAYPYTAGRVPIGWLPCDGRIVSLQQYQALYAVIGNIYGGVANQTFGLPNLKGQAVVGMGSAKGLTPRTQGNQLGVETVALTSAQMPSHNHELQLIQAPAATTNFQTAATSAPNIGATSRLMRPLYLAPTPPPLIGVRAFLENGVPQTNLADSTLGVTGGDTRLVTQPHENRQPAQVLSYFICYDGAFPLQP
jgi:microcystin-dependent protein